MILLAEKLLTKTKEENMKIADLIKNETNSTVYNRARKVFLELRGNINCSRCPYHRKENASRVPKDDRYKDKRNRKQKELERAIWSN